jgi:hypothetical protein
MPLSLWLIIFTFGFTVWLGLYLIARDPNKGRLRYTGLGLAAYALGLALDSLTPYAPIPALEETLSHLRWPLLFVPALCWFAAAVDLLPEDLPIRARLTNWTAYGLPLVIVLLYLASFGVVFLDRSSLHWLLAVVIGLLLLIALGFTWRVFRTASRKRLVGILLTIALFFTLSMGLFLIPLDIFPADWVLLAVELDIFALALCIAALDAFDEGEALLPDMLRSFAVSGFNALIFGGLVILALLPGINFSLLALLYASLFVAIAAQVFADTIQASVDRLVFARLPRLRQNRADLRAAASALPRLNETLLSNLDEVEFSRLTRRALSHISDFNHLAASPLTRLPIIDARLAKRGAADNTLERAAELKSLLVESITRLKPRGKEDFGTSDEWRYYNVLYFPYVVGLKPYSRDGYYHDLDPGTEAVMEWLRTAVPERTLHNWQNAAARLVAQDLREQIAGHWQ